MVRILALIVSLLVALPAFAQQDSSPFLWSAPQAPQPPVPPRPSVAPVPPTPVQPPAPPSPWTSEGVLADWFQSPNVRVAVIGAVSAEGSDFQPGIASYSRNGDFTAFVFTRGNVCSDVATAAEAPAIATFGWQVSVRLLPAPASPTGEYAAFMPASRDVQVDWKRLWDRGERVNAPVRSTRLTITRGARMPLDTFVETEGVPEALANRYPPGHPDLEQARRVSESCKGAAFTLSVGLESEDPAITTARTPRDAVSLAKLKEQLETMSKTLSEKASSLAGPDASLTLAQKTEMQRFVQEQLAEVQRQLRELQNALSAQQRSVAVETARQRLQTMAAARTRATEVRAVKVAGSSGDVEAAMLSARVCASSGPELPNTIRVVGKDGKCVGTMLDDVDQSRLQSGDFDLWLVHTWAGGPAEAQYLKLSVKPLDGKFSFPPMVVESNGQPVNVEVRGYVQVYSLATTPNSAVAPSTVAVGIGRTVTAADKRVIAAGVTSREVTTARVAAAKPGVVSRVGSGASDVISLELPDDTPGLEGHQFSVRVRVPRSTTP